ncbi:MAG: radical SAM protein [Lactobacillales bacterium]|nr:radical SAM protein [Lactobacillales bacterium]
MGNVIKKQSIKKIEESAFYSPKHLQIETVNKLCNAKCAMCTIFTNKRKAKIMNLETFKKIIDKFVPYKEVIEFLTLHGCGEPLLDKTLSEKINYAKKNGFKGIGFSTNAGLLTSKISENLLEAGVDTLIFSIDGFSKEVQEKIRLNAGSFEKIYDNVKNYIKIRNSKNYKSRILIRMIRQKLNYEQWDDYYKYWSNYISKDKGDDIIRFDIHNCGGKVKEYAEMSLPESLQCNSNFISSSKVKVCPDLFERFIIFSDASIGFCSTDQDGYFDFPNILDDEIHNIFNHQIFNNYRKIWLKGGGNTLKYCADCNVINSRNNKTIPMIRSVGEI